MYDAALYYAQFSRKPPVSIPQNFVLCTCHRAVNTDNTNNLLNIFEALEVISNTAQVVLPLHPRTKAKLIAQNYPFEKSKIIFIDPVGYFEILWLLENCSLVITDSGGLQKEASFFNKYGVLLVEATSWVELVENNLSFPVGANKCKIIEASNLALSKQFLNENNLYGDGHASEKICDFFLKH